MLGCVCGFFMGVTVAGRRRPTCRELMRDPDRQPTFAELLMPPPCDRDPDWRRSFNHENINRPTSEPPLRFRRSGDGYSSGPTTPKPDITPKPQPPGGRLIKPSGAPVDPLMDRVAKAIYDAPLNEAGWRSEARAAILEVAAWLTENYASDVVSLPPHQMLRDEANR
jgi:hypothetical protein